MKKISEHHVLHPERQEENDKQAIRNIIESYDIEDAVLILYDVCLEINAGRDYIDTYINEIVENRKNKSND